MMARKKEEVEVSKALAALWLVLFVVTGVLVFSPHLFGYDLFPLAVALLGITVLIYESKIRPALR